MKFRYGLIALLLLPQLVFATKLDQQPKHDSAFAWELVQQGAQLIDVRTPAEYQAETIQQAVNIPLDSLQQRLSELDKARPVIVYCRSGRRSSIAADFLRQQGYQVYDAGTFHKMAVK